MSKKIGDYARRAHSLARRGKTDFETARRAYGGTNRESAQSYVGNIAHLKIMITKFDNKITLLALYD